MEEQNTIPWFFKLGKISEFKEKILFLHAITGCDTIISALINKEKRNTTKTFEKPLDLRLSEEFSNKKIALETIYLKMEYVYTFGDIWSSQVRRFTWHSSIVTFAKSIRFNRAVKLPSPPPTAAAAEQRLYRIYYQR